MSLVFNLILYFNFVFLYPNFILYFYFLFLFSTLIIIVINCNEIEKLIKNIIDQFGFWNIHYEYEKQSSFLSLVLNLVLYFNFLFLYPNFILYFYFLFLFSTLIIIVINCNEIEEFIKNIVDQFGLWKIHYQYEKQSYFCL